MREGECPVGIDIGALFIKAVRLDADGRLLEHVYRSHHGGPGLALETVLGELRVGMDTPVGLTGSAAAPVADLLGVPRLDLTGCQILAVRQEFPDVTHIIDIGGGSSSHIQLDAESQFRGYATNSACAAGTGSFLDEQAARLGISYEEMAVFGTVEDPPTIATRCSVFAKSDLIHRQQEGCSKAAMWSGLCRGMTRTMLGTLLQGKPLDGTAALIGGVARNREVLRWLRNEVPVRVVVPATPHLMAAIGAACQAVPRRHGAGLRANPAMAVDAPSRYPWPLTMKRSVYPSFDAAEAFVDEMDNEIRLLAWPAGQPVRGFLGIDIGSTSTKLALVDDARRVVVDIYRKTGGDPIGATQKLLRALRELSRRQSATVEILGVGTTGSGRKMVGTVIGADAILNEISAHVAGAMQTDPGIDTIFEIGGQDSKYMRIQDGHIHDANMNYVCAAGTGSFVEEQANKLGYPVAQVGAAVLGLHPPCSSDRCTVFMEQDVARLIQSGFCAEEALAGVMVSVVKNYLNKVVGNRPYSRERIFFQGATARNPALIAAFERVLGVPIVVSPYCHIVGAYGVALLTAEAMAARGQTNSAFLGLDLDQREIRISSEVCRLCQNHCRIARAEIEGIAETPSWGYMCGRDPDEDRVKVSRHDRLLRRRRRLWRETGALPVPDTAPLIGVPQALATYSHLPLWRRFFNRLGYRVALSGQTTPEVRDLSQKVTGAEFCFPAKVAQGHIAQLVTKDGVDFVLVPHMVSEQTSKHANGARFCPYVASLPSYGRSALHLNGIDTSRLLTPLVDLRLSAARQLDYLVEALAGPLSRDRDAIGQAWQEALDVQQGFVAACREEGAKVIAEAKGNGDKLLVLIGRSYNIYDTGINLNLPQTLAESGYTVVPLECLGADPALLGKRYRETHWHYGQRIIATLKHVAQDPDLAAVYLTNFNCGPDAFLLSYAHEIMGSRPFLALELDEHGGDAGYRTRIEAFLDVLRQPRQAARQRRPDRQVRADLRDRTLWIAPMHPLGATLVAAAFRRHGYQARPMPPEDQAVLELGRSVTRGSECMPTALTIGGLLSVMKQHPNEKHALFMPTDSGWCRLGQYCVLHRSVLDRHGYEDVPILSPTCQNNYKELSSLLRRTFWMAMVSGDLLLKAAMKVRPDERTAGDTNTILASELTRMESVIAGPGDVRSALVRAMTRFAAIPRRHEPRPLVGIVGEIYLRLNPFGNEDVIGAIERFGGEAWLAPMSEWAHYSTACLRLQSVAQGRSAWTRWGNDIVTRYMQFLENRLIATAGSLLTDRLEPPIETVLEYGRRYVPIEFLGETILTVGRAVAFARAGASLVVNCAPFGCMPGTISAALSRRMTADLGIPMVSLFYDGQGTQNQRLEVFLNNAIAKTSPAQPRTLRSPRSGGRRTHGHTEPIVQRPEAIGCVTSLSD
jgi:predicted CoA-substrate-specific enzyme activase